MYKFIELLLSAVGSAAVCTVLLAAVARPLSVATRRLVYRPGTDPRSASRVVTS